MKTAVIATINQVKVFNYWGLQSVSQPLINGIEEVD